MSGQESCQLGVFYASKMCLIYLTDYTYFISIGHTSYVRNPPPGVSSEVTRQPTFGRLYLYLSSFLFLLSPISRMATGFLQPTSRGSRTKRCKYPDSTSKCLRASTATPCAGSVRYHHWHSPRGYFEYPAINQTQTAIEKSKAPRWLSVLDAQQVVT